MKKLSFVYTFLSYAGVDLGSTMATTVDQTPPIILAIIFQSDVNHPADRTI